MDDQNTLVTNGLLVTALHRLGTCAEAEALGRRSLEKLRRVLGREHHNPLSQQGKYAEAAEIQREVLVTTTRLLGAEHKNTLHTARHLGVSLSQCGQKTEAKQLLRETLALSLRALGPTHQNMQGLLQEFRALSLTAP